jgi:SOS-response transcriptional repressor LexA
MPSGVYPRPKTRVPGGPLTDRQQEILDFIGAFRREHRYTPTVRDIADHFDVHIHATALVLSSLRAKGRLSKPNGCGRGMAILGPSGGVTCPHCDREIEDPSVPPNQPWPGAPPLTQRQEEILRSFRGHMIRFGYTPSLRNVMEETGIGSPNGMMCHVKSLAKKGRISRAGTLARSIVVLPAPGSADCPVCRRPLPVEDEDAP